MTANEPSPNGTQDHDQRIKTLIETLPEAFFLLSLRTILHGSTGRDTPPVR